MQSGNEFDLFPAYPGFPDGRADGVEEVRKKVREVLRAGAEIVKICSTGGVLSPTDHPEFTQYSPEELDVIVREAAYRRGVKVMAHAQGLEGIKNAVRAGIHSIEHGIYLDEEAIELMLEHGTFLVPTLLAPLAVLEEGEKGGMPEYGIRKAHEVMEVHSESIARAYRAGVKIAMGTDAGVMAHGTNLPRTRSDGQHWYVAHGGHCSDDACSRRMSWLAGQAWQRRTRQAGGPRYCRH